MSKQESIVVVFRREVIAHLVHGHDFSKEEAEFAHDNAPASVFDDTTPTECADRIAELWE